MRGAPKNDREMPVYLSNTYMTADKLAYEFDVFGEISTFQLIADGR